MPTPCLQSERILRIESVVDKIAEQVNQISNSVSLMAQTINHMAERVEEHDQTLLGHNGSVGLVANQKSNAEMQENLRVILKGREDQGGLMQTMNTLVVKFDIMVQSQKEASEERRWLTRVVMGIVVVGVIVGLGYLFVSHGVNINGQVVVP